MRTVVAMASKRSPVPSREGYLGDMVAWTFGRTLDKREFSASRERVIETFQAHGFDTKRCFPLEDPAQFLARAPRSGGIVPGGEFVVKELPGAHKDSPLVLCVYERQVEQGENGDEFLPGARVRINTGTQLAQDFAMEDGTERPACRKLAEDIANRCNHLIANVTNQELSHALVEAGREANWAMFRRGTGGAYWVPPFNAERFRALLDDLEKLADGFWPIIQPLFGDEEGRSARNVADAAEACIAADLEEIAKGLEKPDSMKPKAIEKRIELCRSLALRAMDYRDALRGRLASVDQSINDVIRKYGKLLDPTDEADEVTKAIAEV